MICQKVMLIHKPIGSKISDKGKGGIKNLKKWVMFPKTKVLHSYFVEQFILEWGIGSNRKIN